MIHKAELLSEVKDPQYVQRISAVIPGHEFEPAAHAMPIGLYEIQIVLKPILRHANEAVIIQKDDFRG